MQNASMTFTLTGPDPLVYGLWRDLDAKGNKIVNLAPGSASGDAATWGQLDAERATRETVDLALGSLIGAAGAISLADYDTRLAATLANISPLRQIVRTGGYTLPGDGGGALYKRVNVAPSHGAFFQSADGAFFELASTAPDARMFGVTTAAADSMENLRTSARYMNAKGLTIIACDINVTCTTWVEADLALFADITFVGRGALTGVYRKRVIPLGAQIAPSWSASDLIAAKHLTAPNATSGPLVVVIVGDSTWTEFANSVSRQDMAADMVREHVQKQWPGRDIVVHNRAIGGTSWGQLLIGTSAFGPNYPAWMTPGTPNKQWLAYIAELNPDIVVAGWGMNSIDSLDAIRNTVGLLRGMSSAPNVVLATCLVPSLSWAGNANRYQQELRDKEAGMVRSVAAFDRLGLLDFNRQMVIARDGYDPVAGRITPAEDTVAVSGAALAIGTKECSNWKCRVTFNTTDFASGAVTVSLDDNGADFVQIVANAGKYWVVVYAGDGTGFTSIANKITTEAIPAATNDTLTIEKRGNEVIVYRETTPDLGAYQAPIAVLPCMSRGGLYKPRVGRGGSTAISNVVFAYSEPRLSMPTLTNKDLWGDGSNSWQVNGNHPTGFAGSHVYRPVLDAQTWGGVSNPTNSAALSFPALGASGGASDRTMPLKGLRATDAISQPIVTGAAPPLGVVFQGYYFSDDVVAIRASNITNIVINAFNATVRVSAIKAT